MALNLLIEHCIVYYLWKNLIYREYIFKTKLPLLNKALDTYSLRQQTIAKNIANATTVDYVPEKVKFEEYFKEAKAKETGLRTEDTHIPINPSGFDEVSPTIVKEDVPESEKLMAGVSHVNLDKEMSELAQNQIKFRFAARMVKRYFSGLNTAITGFRE